MKIARRELLKLALAASGASLGTPASAFLFADDQAVEGPGILTSEFVYETAPTPSCHASTIAESQGKLVASWFGGTAEGNKDVGIWVSVHQGDSWGPPKEVANGVDGSERHPCWNPVLFQPKKGPLLLFYKVGPSPRTWWGMVIESNDGGATWSEPRRLPNKILGPIKNKPIELADGTILCPTSTEHEGWRVHFEWTKDLGHTWESTGPINDGVQFGAIQPTILTFKNGHLQALSRSKQGKIVECWSKDQGKSWTALRGINLPNPNSGIDGVTLNDGRHLLVYNHTRKGRTPLNLGISDDGVNWKSALVLETASGEYSYPAIIQTKDGKVHIAYTWNRKRIRHVVVDPAKLVGVELPTTG